MVQLTDLSVELLLLITSSVTQTDLLNISLASKYLRTATEPELFREYVNRCSYGRSLLPFIRLLLERPKLARYVQRLELKPWETLDALNPMYHEGELSTDHVPQPSELEYTLVTSAAKALGIIDYITPYEPESSLVNKADTLLKAGDEHLPQPWFKHIFDSNVVTSQVPYTQRFCMLLRAGIEDPYIALLIHMLPNVREILMHGAPDDLNALPWTLPRHKFDSLRKFSALSFDPYNTWPAAFFNILFEGKNLATLETCFAGEYWKDPASRGLIPNSISLNPGSLAVTRLDLQYCAFSQGGMKTLLEACPQMKSLYYSTRDADDSQHHLNPAALSNLSRTRWRNYLWTFTPSRNGISLRVSI